MNPNQTTPSGMIRPPAGFIPLLPNSPLRPGVNRPTQRPLAQPAPRPQSFNINVPQTIPSTVLGSNVSTGDLTSMFSDYVRQQQALQSQLTGAYAPSQEETNARNALMNFDQSYRKGMEKIETKPIAMEFITGQQAALQRQAGIERQGLAETYSALSEDRKSKVDSLQKQWEIANNMFSTGVDVLKTQKEFDRLDKEAQKLDTSVQKLDNGETILIDNQTGKIIKSFGGIAPTTGGVGTVGVVPGTAGYRQQSATNVLNYVDTALSQIKPGTAGFGSGLLSKIGGSGAKNLRETLETVKGNIGFEALQAMREASKTGGALGSIAVQELTALQSVLGSLDARQSRSQLRQNLNNIKGHYTKAMEAINQANGQTQTAEQPQVNENDPLGLFN